MIIMAEKKTGISRDLIIHPGETLAEVMNERGLSQSELAARAGFSPAYVSNVISGKKDISAKFAQALEYVLSIPKSFWLNLQANYDAELLDYNEKDSVTDEEKDARNHLSGVVKFFCDQGKMKKYRDRNQSILELRKILQVSNLCNLKNIVPEGNFRISSSASVDPYVLGAWLRLCQMASENQKVSTKFDEENIDVIINGLKNIMRSQKNNTVHYIQALLSKNGISFSVLHNFRGAPVHGYISEKKDGTYHMVLTIRGSYADIFWFSLFHELGHIVNHDVRNQRDYIDWGENQEAESAADQFASDHLLKPEDYRNFVNAGKFNIAAICDFAESQNVEPYIVIGRLQKEKKIRYNQFSNYKLRYKWKDQTDQDCNNRI